MNRELEGRSIARLMPAFKSRETQEGYLTKLRFVSVLPSQRILIRR